MAYKKLGSHSPLSELQKDFLRCREFFEANRMQWLAEARPKYVVLKNAELVGFYDVEGFTHGVSLPDSFKFELISPEEELKRWLDNKHSSFSLLAEPFLDTDDPESEYTADRVLEARGYPPFLQSILRKVLYTGLFWNHVLWWDWVQLSFSDFLIGWALNLFILAWPTIALADSYLGDKVALSIFLAMLAPLTLFLAYVSALMVVDKLRKGTGDAQP